jgi:hypothetical protein
MKPVPFAEYLARHQPTPMPEPTPVWPPPKKRTADEPPARVSPLLRRPESPSADPRPATGPKLEQGMLKAFEEGRDAARRELAIDRDRQREDFADQIMHEREKWAREEGDRLIEAHRAAMADFETRCAQTVANILRPFLTQAVIARVTDALVQNLEVLFASRTQSLFEICGPADLLDALRAKFENRQAAISYSLSDSIDVRVRVDDTIIETQLGAWMEALGALSPEIAQENSA